LLLIVDVRRWLPLLLPLLALAFPFEFEFEFEFEEGTDPRLN
jgi:hypothetical protein